MEILKEEFMHIELDITDYSINSDMLYRFVLKFYHLVAIMILTKRCYNHVCMDKVEIGSL